MSSGVARWLLALMLAVGTAHAALAQAPAEPTGDAASGAKLYVDRACWQCHGLVAQGGGIAGPRLAGRVQVWAAFAAYVRRPTEEMIPYTTKVLPDDELADIFAWLRGLPPPPAVESLPVFSRPLEGREGAGNVGALMPDGKVWTIENLNSDAADSYCYADRESNCGLYGRLYTWESAQRACSAVGAGWRLPTDGDWRELARHFGGVFDDAADRGRAAYHALLRGGRAGFGAVLGGGRAGDGQYDDVDAHGFYWTATEGVATAVFYNFGRGSTALYRQLDGEKPMALSVRCVREA